MYKIPTISLGIYIWQLRATVRELDVRSPLYILCVSVCDNDYRIFRAKGSTVATEINFNLVLSNTVTHVSVVSKTYTSTTRIAHLSHILTPIYIYIYNSSCSPEPRESVFFTVEIQRQLFSNGYGFLRLWQKSHLKNKNFKKMIKKVLEFFLNHQFTLTKWNIN